MILIWTENKTSFGDYIALWFGSTVGHMNACGQEAFYINLSMSHGFALDVAGSYFGRHNNALRSFKLLNMISLLLSKWHNG